MLEAARLGLNSSWVEGQIDEQLGHSFCFAVYKAEAGLLAIIPLMNRL
jgi:hypothetical protein